MADRNQVDHSPTGQATRRAADVKGAYATIRRAWQYAPDHTMAGRGPDPGPTTGGGRSDPTARAASTGDAQRQRVLADLARITIELGTKLTDVDGVERPGSIDYLTRHYHRPKDHLPPRTAREVRSHLLSILGLHSQWFEQLVKRVRDLDADPDRYPEAPELAMTVHAHANALVRSSRWAHGQLVRPPAPDDLRVCDDDNCQDVLDKDDVRYCKVCASRRDRAAAMRAAEIAREQARPLCPDCGTRLTEADVDDGHHQCLDCRTPRCGAEIRADCTRPLKADDIARNATNCQPCRNWQSWKTRQEPQPAGAAAADPHPWEWREPT